MASRARKGFTLFEAIVAVLIIGLTATAALEAVGTELRTQYTAQRMMEAQALAVTKMATIQLLTAEELQLLPDSIREGTFEAPMANYRWTTSSKPIDDEDSVNDITLKIEWKDGAYTLRTYLFRPSAITANRITP